MRILYKLIYHFRNRKPKEHLDITWLKYRSQYEVRVMPYSVAKLRWYTYISLCLNEEIQKDVYLILRHCKYGITLLIDIECSSTGREGCIDKIRSYILDRVPEYAALQHKNKCTGRAIVRGSVGKIYP